MDNCASDGLQTDLGMLQEWPCCDRLAASGMVCTSVVAQSIRLQAGVPAAGQVAARWVLMGLRVRAEVAAGP